MNRFKNPIEGYFSQHPSEQGGGASEAALQLSSDLHPALKIFEIAKSYFKEDIRDRLADFSEAVRLQNDWLEEQIQTHSDLLGKIEAMLNSPDFKNAVVSAIDEVRRGATKEKTEKLAAVLVRSLGPEQPEEYRDEVVSFVRDIVNLTENDIRALRIMAEAYTGIIHTMPNFHDPNAFTGQLGVLNESLDRLNIHRDDFYSACARLSGFGLALEVERNHSRMSLGEYCFRPTRRGLKLLRLLGPHSNPVT